MTCHLYPNGGKDTDDVSPGLRDMKKSNDVSYKPKRKKRVTFRVAQAEGRKRMLFQLNPNGRKTRKMFHLSSREGKIVNNVSSKQNE